MALVIEKKNRKTIFSSLRVIVRGGGDLGSGVVYRLYQAGFRVLVTELAEPLLVRRAVAYGTAMIEGRVVLEGLAAVRVGDLNAADLAFSREEIPVIADDVGRIIASFAPDILIDARMRKAPPEPLNRRPSLLIGLGPGFSAPENCDYVIETMRGHSLGRVIREGSAIADSGIPGEVRGKAAGRVLRAPAAGEFYTEKRIGERVQADEEVANVAGQPLVAPFTGVIRGLIHNGIHVSQGMKVGDVDPRDEPAFCFTISEKALAIAGGVMEAILSDSFIQQSNLGSR